MRRFLICMVAAMLVTVPAVAGDRSMQFVIGQGAVQDADPEALESDTQSYGLRFFDMKTDGYYGGGVNVERITIDVDDDQIDDTGAYCFDALFRFQGGKKWFEAYGNLGGGLVVADRITEEIPIGSTPGSKASPPTTTVSSTPVSTRYVIELGVDLFPNGPVGFGLGWQVTGPLNQNTLINDTSGLIGYLRIAVGPKT